MGTARTSTVRPVESMTTLQWAAVILAAATGAIHLYLGATSGLPPFVLAGVGFFAGVVVFFTRYWRRWFYPIAAVYTLVQIVAWIAAGTRFFQIGAVDKAIQAAFVVVVLYLYWTGEGHRPAV